MPSVHVQQCFMYKSASNPPSFILLTNLYPPFIAFAYNPVLNWPQLVLLDNKHLYSYFLFISLSNLYGCNLLPPPPPHTHTYTAGPYFDPETVVSRLCWQNMTRNNHSLLSALNSAPIAAPIIYAVLCDMYFKDFSNWMCSLSFHG